MDHVTNKDKNKQIKRYSKNSYKDFKDSTNDEIHLEDSFPIAMLKLFFPDLKDDEIDQATEDLKKNDAGVDAYFTIEDDAYICQFKTCQEFNKSINREDLSHLSTIVNRLKNISNHSNSRIRNITQEIKSFDEENIHKYFFTNSFHNLSTLKEEFSNLKIIGGEKIYEKIKEYENISNEEILPECEIEFETPQNSKNEKKYDNKIINFYSPIKGKETSIGLISGAEVTKLMKQYSYRLFTRNVRYYMEKSQINKEMVKTAKEDPKNFYYYNNGVTITCEKMDKIGNKLKLTKPQVINGAQTFNSIYKAYNENPTGAIADVKILAVVITSTKNDEADFAKQLTKFRNANNSMQDSDYKANDPIQRKLQQHFYDFRYFYEIKRGEKDYYKSNQHKNNKCGHETIKDFTWKSDFNKEKFLDIKTLTSLWCAYKLQDPTTAKMSPKSIFKEDNNSKNNDKTIYKQLFPSKTEITKDTVKEMIFTKRVFDKLIYISKRSKDLIDKKILTDADKELLSGCFDRIYTNFPKNNEKHEEGEKKFQQYLEYLNYSKYHIISSISYITKEKKIDIIKHEPHNSSAVINIIITKWLYTILKYGIHSSYVEANKPTSFIAYSKKKEFWESLKNKLGDLDNDYWNKLTLY